ncbi:MAG: glutathione S-transferase [Pseudomonadota bacterium]
MSLPEPVRYYHTPRAPNPRRTQIFMAEKGIKIRVLNVSIMDGEHRKKPYLDKTGVPQVPALELSDGTVLTEVPAICRYLEALNPEPNLMGDDPLERALVDMWQRRMELRVMAPIATAFRHLNPAMADHEEQVADWGNANLGRIDRRLGELDKQLRGQQWIALDRITLADITGFVAVDFLRILKRKIPEHMPSLNAWYQRMRSRPSTEMK